MATRECSEAASGVMWSILEQDVMLGFSAQMLHRYMEGAQRVGVRFWLALSCAHPEMESRARDCSAERQQEK